MKISILADSISSQNSGIYYFGKQLVRRMLEKFPEHDYELIATEKIDEFDVFQKIIPVSTLPLHLRWRQLTSIPKYLKKSAPDHVLELAHFGPFRLNKNINRTTVIHDLTPITHPQFHDRFSTQMHKALLPNVLKNATTIITNSYSTKTEIEKFDLSSKEKIFVVYPEIEYPENVESFSEDTPTTIGAYLLSVGTIEPRKNYDILLDAFKLIGEKFPDLKLVIAGKHGWKTERFDQNVAKHPFKNRIKTTGYVSRKTLWEWYENASLFVYPSIFEGFGIPIIEASQMKLPLVLSNIPTSKEIAGSNALYFEYNDKVALAKHVLSLLENKDRMNQAKHKSSEIIERVNSKSDQQLEHWFKAITKKQV